MKYLSILAVFLAFTSLAALAHGGKGHSHQPIDEAQAKQRASDAVIELVIIGKVDAGWKAHPNRAKKEIWVAIRVGGDIRGHQGDQPRQEKTLCFS